MMFQKLEVKKIGWWKDTIMVTFIRFLNKCELTFFDLQIDQAAATSIWPEMTFQLRSSPRCHGSRRVHNDANKFSLTFELVAAPFSASEIEGHGWQGHFKIQSLDSRLDKSFFSLISANKLINRFIGDVVHRLNKVELQCKASFECRSHQDSKVKFCFSLNMEILCFISLTLRARWLVVTKLVLTVWLQQLDCNRKAFIYPSHLRLIFYHFFISKKGSSRQFRFAHFVRGVWDHRRVQEVHFGWWNY